MELNFNHFYRVLEEKKVDKVSNESNDNYVLMTVINRTDISSIHFDNFSFDDVIDVFNELENAITDENMDGEINIDPNHSYSLMLSLGLKISKVLIAPKIRVPSPFPFI
ncbi:hypothetical protein B14911_10482 [Bacillus sp. NRRL B-14911]|uniref:hypothetical protein n=1 Tax=Bacillus sp. NRRL B-14911 TaxID=313627 RepID=UPI00006B59C4|nr:hypothetical protein [Bacillus sp. NRRL B-14911]EAR66154.1 hypothetical protein B14911_10482 [Bacillus sp. NRRL B-14911]